MTKTYSERMAEAQAARAKHEATKDEFKTRQLESAPQDHIHLPLGFRLSASKRFYYAPLNCMPLTSPLSTLTPTHFAVLHQCGKNLAHTKHEISIWTITPDEYGNTPKVVGDIIESAPTLHGTTTPFIFHDDSAALEALRAWIRLNLDKHYTFNEETLEWALD